MQHLRIRNIHRPLIRRKANAVRPTKPIRHSSDISARGIKAIDLVRQLRRRADALLGAVDGIGEPDGPVRAHDDDVVGRVEAPAVVVVQQHFGLVRWGGCHVGQAAGHGARALGAEEDAVFVFDAAVGVGDVGRGDGFVGPGCVGGLADSADGDVLRAVGGVIVLVACYEEASLGLNVDACFVGVRVVGEGEDCF